MLVLVVGFLIGTCAAAALCEESACQNPVDFCGEPFEIDTSWGTLRGDGDGGGGGGPPIPG